MMDDSFFINKENVVYYVNTNESVLKKPIKAICLEFPGLGGGSCIGGCLDIRAYDYGPGEALGKEGVLLAYVFTGPWSWMNRGAVRITDLVVDALKEKYELPKDCPIIAIGGSMGGAGALMYTLKSKNSVKACVAACPCLDVRRSFYCAPDVPRSILVGIGSYDISFDAAIDEISPITKIDEMPYVPYYIINDCADELFPVEIMDGYVESMRTKGHNVEYTRLEGCKHGELPDEERANIVRYILNAVEA